MRVSVRPGSYSRAVSRAGGHFYENGAREDRPQKLTLSLPNHVFGYDHRETFVVSAGTGDLGS